MWRSFFLAFGIFSLILGGETLVVDKFLMNDSSRTANFIRGNRTAAAPGTQPYYQQAGYSGAYTNGSSQIVPNQVVPRRVSRVVQTKDWMPWSLLATGAVIVLYTYSLPNRRDEH